MDNIVELFYRSVLETILANMPKWTRNMMTHTEQRDYGDAFAIVVSGPTKSGFDYASKVNEMLEPTKSGPNIGRLNYHYIEKTIIQVARVYGLKVEGYE